MTKLFKFITIAVAGVAIGTVAGRFVKNDKAKIIKNSQPVSDLKNQPSKENEKDSGDKDLSDLDNCFI